VSRPGLGTQVIEKRKLMAKLKSADGADPDDQNADLRKQLNTAILGTTPQPSAAFRLHASLPQTESTAARTRALCCAPAGAASSAGAARRSVCTRCVAG
jgi:hypothetical protein